MKNIESSTAVLKGLLVEVESGGASPEPS